MTAIETADRFMAGAKNLAECTDEQLHGVVQSVLKLSPTDRENCILALYHRAYLDLKTITRVEGIRDLQSICRAARAMLEYAVDLRLTEIIPDATSKQLA